MTLLLLLGTVSVNEFPVMILLISGSILWSCFEAFCIVLYCKCFRNKGDLTEFKCLLDHEESVSLKCLHSMYTGMRDPPMGGPVQPYR